MTSRNVAAPKPSRGIVKFYHETMAELRKVVWLTRREAAYMTGIVLLVSIATGIILGAIDFGFSALVNVLIAR